MEYNVKITLPGYVFCGVLCLLVVFWGVVEFFLIGLDLGRGVAMLFMLIFGYGCLSSGMKVQKVNHTDN